MKLKSKALTSSEDFLANRKAHLEALGLVEEAVAAAAQGGGEAARDRQRSRGKMPPRERVANLLDPGSPFGHTASLRTAGEKYSSCSAAACAAPLQPRA